MALLRLTAPNCITETWPDDPRGDEDRTAARLHGRRRARPVHHGHRNRGIAHACSQDQGPAAAAISIGQEFRLLAELSAIAAFFMVQPVMIAFLVAKALDRLNPAFSRHVIEQLRASPFKITRSIP